MTPTELRARLRRHLADPDTRLLDVETHFKMIVPLRIQRLLYADSIFMHATDAHVAELMAGFEDAEECEQIGKELEV